MAFVVVVATFFHAALFVERCSVMVAPAIPVVLPLSVPLIVKCVLTDAVGGAVALSVVVRVPMA